MIFCYVYRTSVAKGIHYYSDNDYVTCLCHTELGDLIMCIPLSLLTITVAWLITDYSRTRRKAQIGLCKYYYKVQATAKHEHSEMNCPLIYKTHDLIMVEGDVTLQNQQRQTGA